MTLAARPIMGGGSAWGFRGHSPTASHQAHQPSPRTPPLKPNCSTMYSGRVTLAQARTPAPSAIVGGCLGLLIANPMQGPPYPRLGHGGLGTAGRLAGMGPPPIMGTEMKWVVPLSGMGDMGTGGRGRSLAHRHWQGRLQKHPVWEPTPLDREVTEGMEELLVCCEDG